MTPTFRRTRHGDVVAHLHAEEVSLLRRLPDDLRPVIDVPLAEAVTGDERDDAGTGTGTGAGADVAGSGVDPVRERLFPRAYLDPTEEGAEVEWQRMVHPELVRSKLDALAVLGASLERATAKGNGLEVVLSPDEVDAWLGALNDARLALGVALGINEDPLEDLLAPDDPAAPGLAVYQWLTGLQGVLVDVLLG